MKESITVNGISKEYELHPETPILSFVRNYAMQFGTKYGCGVDKCGACTVFLGDEKVHSCQMKLSELSGRDITTVEGFIRDNPQHPLLKAWIELEVPQCGYCQPGMLLSAADLLAKNQDPTREEIAEHMSHNLCRCGTYPRVYRAIEQAATELRQGEGSNDTNYVAAPEEVDPS